MHVGMVSFTDVDSAIDLANALRAAGVSVTLYLAHASAAQAVSDDTAPAERLHMSGLLAPDIAVRVFRLPRMRDLRSFLTMRKIARTMVTDRIDVAHVLMGSGEVWTAVLAWLVRRVPVVSTMIIPKHNVGEFPPAVVASTVNRLLANASDVVIVNGRDQLDTVAAEHRVPMSRLTYIPLGARSVFQKWAKKKVSEEPGMILFFGRLNKHKGLEYLVRAEPLISARIPHAKIVIAGQGDDLARCRQWMREGGCFEIHEGYVPGAEAAALFQRAAVVAVPYVSAATSGVVMTAAVFAKPVVATPVGSLPEYVEDGVTGLLVSPGSVEELANALVRLLSDDALRHGMGDRAAQRLEEDLSWTSIATQTRAAYERAIGLHSDGVGMSKMVNEGQGETKP